MIVYPKDWRKTGIQITIQDIEDRLEDVLINIKCKSLSFSGGLDSTLLLYFMCQIYKTIKVFTIGGSKDHPDVIFAKKIAHYYRERFFVTIEHYCFYPSLSQEAKELGDEKFVGDNAVELFYKNVANHTDEIIAGDGVDEFMCGYYAHSNHPDEETYFYYLRQLCKKHLIPLDSNSDKIRVYLPYIDEGIISLMSQIPLGDKIDEKNRKKFMIDLAEGKVPKEIIRRRKYGFCDAFLKKEKDG